MKFMRFILFFSFLGLFTVNSTFAQIITNKQLLSKMDSMLNIQKLMIPKANDDIHTILKNKMTDDERLAYKFVVAFSPLSDLADYSGQFIFDNVKVALKAKSETKWGSTIPEDVFAHFVLPMRVNNENLDSFRLLMYDEIYNRVKSMDLYRAALEVNHWCHEKATYRGSDARTSSPLATMKYSFGRCGEESTFLVAALRTVGIPARQVYTPRWAHSDDNHAWVEVWVDGKWYFLGACEPSPELNMGWFAVPSTRTMLVHTRAFGAYYGPERVVIRTDRFSELNLISNYAKSKDIFIKVVDEKNHPVENAIVEFELYNYAEFYPLAKAYTDNKGIALMHTGLGDLIIWAHKGNTFGFNKITVPTQDSITITIKDEFPNNKIFDFDLVPPKEGKTIEVSQANAKLNESRLLIEDSIRSVYMQSFLDSAEAYSKLKSINIENPKLTEFLVKSYGNHDEIYRFIKETKPENINDAESLLSSISDKDLRDTRARILRGLLNSGLKYKARYKGNEELWIDNILCGRIANEMMTDYTSIGELVTKNWKMKKDYELNANEEVRYDRIKEIVNAHIRIDTIANAHSRAPLTPLGVYKLKTADPISRDIFYVALCRSLGMPARINSVTSIPQAYINGNWKDIKFTSDNSESGKKAYIKFVNKSSFDPKYYTNFTLEHFNDGVYRTLEFDDIMPVSAFKDSVEIPVGNYMLVTGNRKPDASVLARTYFFEIKENEYKTINVEVRDLPKEREIWNELNTNDFNVISIDYSRIFTLKQITGNKDYVLAFIEPDKEPSKHIMADLSAVKSQLEASGIKFIFILEKGKAQDDFKPGNYYDLPLNSIYVWDVDSKMIKYFENIKKMDLISDFPIIISSGADNKLDFFTKGYRIGIGEDLLKCIKNRK